MSSTELHETGTRRKLKDNEKLQPWVTDFTTGMACRPPRTIRWERIHKNSLNLSGSLPSLIRGDPENSSPVQHPLSQKSTLANTKSTQTPPLSELLSSSPSHSCRLERFYCEELRRREKYHYLSLAHLAATGTTGGGGTCDGGGRSNSRRSSLCLGGGGVTDWHQMGKELRQIADDLQHHRCCRSSTTSLESTSSAESGLNAFSSSGGGNSSSKTTTLTSTTTMTSTNNLHKTAAMACTMSSSSHHRRGSRDDDDHYLLYRSQSLSAASSFNDLRDRRNNKSK